MLDHIADDLDVYIKLSKDPKQAYQNYQFKHSLETEVLQDASFTVELAKCLEMAKALQEAGIDRLIHEQQQLMLEADNKLTQAKQSVGNDEYWDHPEQLKVKLADLKQKKDNLESLGLSPAEQVNLLKEYRQAQLDDLTLEKAIADKKKYVAVKSQAGQRLQQYQDKRDVISEIKKLVQQLFEYAYPLQHEQDEDKLGEAMFVIKHKILIIQELIKPLV